MARIALLFACTLCWIAPARVAAQTLEEMVTAAEVSATGAGLAQVNPVAFRALVEARAALAEANVLGESAAVFATKYTSPGFMALAHRQQDQQRERVGKAIDTLKGLANTIFTVQLKIPAPPLLKQGISLIQDAELDAGFKLDQEVLRRFEIKYGPNSAKLNALETIVSYGLQRLPAFGAGTSGPGPLEAVLSYSAAYLTYGNDQARIIGVAEFGLRNYIFTKGWGTGTGRTAWLKPRYLSYGVAVAGESDEPMRSPFEGRARVGGFFGWGELKVAFVMRGDKRLLVTQQLQIIPLVF
jgi:hypothetical protein